VTSEGVNPLTAETFDTVVDGSKGAFIEFFAPWCGHCQRLAPEYEKVGEAFANDKNVVVASVDCDAHNAVCSRFGIQGFPTLKYFPRGSKEPQEYDGGRTAEDIITYINDHAGAKGKIKKAASSVVDLTSSNFDEVVNKQNTLVEFFAPWCGHCKRLAPDYEKVGAIFANDNRQVVIAKVNADDHKALATRFGVTGYPTLKWFPKGSTEPETYESGRDVDSFVKFVNEKAGTLRDSNGRLLPEAGLVASLKDHAKNFLSSDASDFASKIKEVEEAVAALADDAKKNGEFYLKVFKAIAEKGKDFITTEIARLERMLQGGNLHPSKVDEFSTRMNILRNFQ
jgi:protein disulfide-isomerase A6